MDRQDKQDFISLPTVIPASLPSFPASLPSFPRKRESSGGLPRMRRHKAVPFWIPAYAGMTVTRPGMAARKDAKILSILSIHVN